MRGHVNKLKMLLCIMPLILSLQSCVTVQLDNAKRFMAHPEFPAAVEASPNLLRQMLIAINALEQELEIK